MNLVGQGAFCHKSTYWCLQNPPAECKISCLPGISPVLPAPPAVAKPLHAPSASLGWFFKRFSVFTTVEIVWFI